MDSRGWVIGVDIGGTKIAAAALTCEGEWLARARPRAVTPGDGEACWESLRQVVNEVVTSVAANLPHLPDSSAGAFSEPRALGVSMAAVINRETGTVTWAPNLPAWNGFPLAARLQSEFGCPTFVDFDGHMALLGEYWLGAGRGLRNVCMLVVGTGIGGGLIADGRLVRGSSGIAGAFGWMAGGDLAAIGLELAGGRRTDEPYPGWTERWPQIGWLESLAAGPAIHARAVHLARTARSASRERGGDDSKDGCSGCYPDTRAVFAAARSGDPVAARVVAETGWLLGLIAANVASFFGPERFILGGGVGEEADLLIPPMRAAVERFAQPFAARRLELIAARLGNAAALAGAARLAWEALGVLPAAAYRVGLE